MKIAIIGAGKVGGAVATGAVTAGHVVTVTDADAAAAHSTADRSGAQASSELAGAVAEADVVVLAVPYGALSDVASQIASGAQGKVVIDATNPLKPDYSGLAVSGRSGAEEVQDLLPGAKVVKAFNTTFASNQATGSVDGLQLDGFHASDDKGAKAVVAELLSGLGYRPVDAGPLSAAQALEHMAFLNISLNATNCWSWRSGWKLVGPHE